MSEVPHESSADIPLETPAETRRVAEEVRRHSPAAHHADNFSLSALFLLMVTVAAILGFVSNALPGRSVVDKQASVTTYSRKAEPLQAFAAIVLVLIGIFEGGRAGYFVRRRFTTLVVGSFYGMIAAAIPIAALIYPPSWLMVCVSCGMLITTGIVLGTKSKRTMAINELESTGQKQYHAPRTRETNPG